MISGVCYRKELVTFPITSDKVMIVYIEGLAKDKTLTGTVKEVTQPGNHTLLNILIITLWLNFKLCKNYVIKL